ncbi:MAG: DUF4238 domain-containing protein [Nitrospirota bacterium]
MKKLFSTKRQHYVPRFLLRQFSSDGRSISMLVLKTGRRIEEASIIGQCYGDYFYGQDGTMEQAFAKEEAEVGSLVRDASPMALEKMTQPQLGALIKFVYWQRVRTQGTVDEMNKQTDAVTKSLLREMVARNPNAKFTQKDLDSVVIKLTDPQSEAIFAASKSFPLIFDLSIKFVIAPPDMQFAVSDHPVAKCNQFVENDPYLSQRPGWTGLAAKGLQFFLPLSPQVTVAIYDPTTYEYGSPKSLLCHAGVRDVAVLNRLQAVTAVDALYFTRTFPERLIEKLLTERNSHRPIRETDVQLSSITMRPDGKASQLMLVTGVNLRLGRKLSFVKLLERTDYRNYMAAIIPVRNEGLLQLSKGFSKYLDEEVEEGRRKLSYSLGSGTDGERGT